MRSNIKMYKVAYDTSKNFDLTHSPDRWGWVNMSDIESVHTCTRVIFYVRRIGLYLYKYKTYGTISIYILKGLASIYQLI